MVKLILLTMILGVIQTRANNFVDFVEGLANGYGMDAICVTSINSASTAWTTYKTPDLGSKGSGKALYELHDFTLALTTVSNNCDLLQIASLVDQAFNTNLIATLIRFVASFTEIKEQYDFFSSAWATGLYEKAGESIGEIIKYLID